MTDTPLPLTAHQDAQLEQYLALLAKWNKVYNLTAVRDVQAMRTHHLQDCLAVLAPLARELPTPAGELRAPARVLDVGAGGGLPGVVLAVCRPDLEVVCVDAVGKKAAFVQQVAGQLGLPNLRGVHSRVELLPSGPRGEGFDLITSRAFASLSDFVQLTAALFHVKQGAPLPLWMAMKGKMPHQEIEALPQWARAERVEPLEVPGLDEERCLVWIRPDISHPLFPLAN